MAITCATSVLLTGVTRVRSSSRSRHRRGAASSSVAWTFGLAAVAEPRHTSWQSRLPNSREIPRNTVAIVGVNLTALVLLAYVAMVIAREQPARRDAAIRLSTIDSRRPLHRTYYFAAVDREIARSARSTGLAC